MTITDWSKVAEKRIALARLLSDPTMIEALKVLVDNEVPTLDTKGGTAQDVLMFNGLQHARRAGFHEAIASLKRLAVDPTPPKQKLTKKVLKQINIEP